MCFSGKEAPRTYPSGQPGCFKETGQEVGTTTGKPLYVLFLKTSKACFQVSLP